MTEFLVAEKRVGLHYKRSQKCFIDSAALPPLLVLVSPRIPTELRKLG
jgi:hypothetical protein